MYPVGRQRVQDIREYARKIDRLDDAAKKAYPDLTSFVRNKPSSQIGIVNIMVHFDPGWKGTCHVEPGGLQGAWT